MGMQCAKAVMQNVSVNFLVAAGVTYGLAKGLGVRSVTWDAKVGGGVAVGITLIATACEKLYQKSRKDLGDLTPAKKLLTYCAAGAVVALGCFATKTNIPMSAIAAFTALSYVTTTALQVLRRKFDLSFPITKVVREDIKAIYFSLPQSNVYHDAADMRKGKKPGRDTNSPEWKAFVKEATGRFSLKNIADRFAEQCSSERVGTLSSKPEWSGCNFFKKIDTSVKDKSQEEIADHMWGCISYHLDTDDKIIFFSTADGSGPGLEPGLIAGAANEGFGNYIKSCFSKGSLTPSKLVRATVLAVNAAQENTLREKNKDGNPANACTTHLGLVVYWDNTRKLAHCCFSSVGDCKLLARYPDGKIVDLTSHANREDVTDPGGQLGPKYVKKVPDSGISPYGEIPDLRNLTVGYVQLPEGAALIPMTDGVYDNVPVEKISSFIGQETGKEAVETIMKAAMEKVGKPDDTSCAWIDLK